MEIFYDYSYVSEADEEFISRGYACKSLYSLCFSYVLTEAQQAKDRAYTYKVGLDRNSWNTHAAAARQRSEHMERVAAVLAQNFKVCRYGEEEAVPYSSDWDLYFWCDDFSQTMQWPLSGRDYSYFTLSFNDKHDHERRQKVYNRAMRILELFSDDENLHIDVQYEAIMDDARIKHDAALAAPGIAGRKCVYGGMEGRVETNGEALFFRKKRSRKCLYRLTDTEILSISWQLSA